MPPVLCTRRVLSLPVSALNAFAKGAETEYTAHWPYVGELAAEPVGNGESTMDL